MSEGIAAQLIKVITSHQDIRRVPEPDKVLLKDISDAILRFVCNNELQDLQLQGEENLKFLYEQSKFSIIAEPLLHATGLSENSEMKTVFINHIKEKNEKAEKPKKHKEAIANYTSRTSLHRVAEVGDTREVMKLLRDREVDYNYADENGMTPLHHAVKHGHRLTTLMLLARENIKIDEKDKEGKTPLMHALIEKTRTKEEYKQKQYDIIARELLVLGASAVTLSRAFATG